MDEVRAGETILLVTVPQVEPLVDHWRQQFDSSAPAGAPAHVTVIAPFLDIGRIDEDVLDTLRALIGARNAFEVRFERCGRFPGVLCLAPTPAEPFRELTGALVTRWPEAPPYGGQFPEVVPHLTVARGPEPEEVFEEIEAALAKRLPVVSRVTAVQLFVSDGVRWEQQAEFPLLG